MFKSIISFSLFFISAFISVGSINAHAATTAQIICSKAGALVVRARKCKRGETRLNVSQLVQQSVASVTSLPGPQGLPGDKGDTGPVGPKGDPAGFDVATCYKLETTNGALANAPANAAATRSLNCNNPATEFMLSSSFNVSPLGSAGNRPFVQAKSVVFDPTNKYPIGVSYTFIQSASAAPDIYAAFAQVTCCQR